MRAVGSASRSAAVRRTTQTRWSFLLYFVGTVLLGAQQPVDVVDGAHAAADGERDEDLLRRAAHDVVGRLPVAAARRHVEEGQLVDALLVVELGELDGVAGVAEVLEVDALDDPARRRRRGRR